MTGRTDASDVVVVIPTRSRWDILRRTLDALGRQTAAGAQVVVVVDGDDLDVPSDLAADEVLVQPHAGPAAARNRGVAASDRPVVLFLGDDMIPSPGLVERHLAWHDRHPERTVAVLGHVDWHPDVVRNRILDWLDWSGTQFDYQQLGGAEGQDVGFGRFYSCNVSLKRSLFESVGGFDPDFIFYYEDLDAGWRLHEAGMELRYEPAAVAHHLHDYRMHDVRRRFEGIALGERLMAAKHPWFTPWFHERVSHAAAHPPVRELWARLAYRLPHWAWRAHVVRHRANLWYLQQVGSGFLESWDRAAEVAELYEYLGDDFDARLIAHAHEAVNHEAAGMDEVEFYRTSTAYLYDLTVFAMSGSKDPYHEELTRHVPPGARLLDYGCGIGADGLRLLDQGYDVTFADFANPSSRYLQWRLARRGHDARVLDIEADPIPAGFDAAYAFDVIEHVPDPHAFLDVLEASADLVVVNLLEEDEHHHERDLHHDLPIDELVGRARTRGLVSHTRWHDGRSHLLVYRGSTLG